MMGGGNSRQRRRATMDDGLAAAALALATGQSLPSFAHGSFAAVSPEGKPPAKGWRRRASVEEIAEEAPAPLACPQRRASIAQVVEDGGLSAVEKRREVARLLTEDEGADKGEGVGGDKGGRRRSGSFGDAGGLRREVRFPLNLDGSSNITGNLERSDTGNSSQRSGGSASSALWASHRSGQSKRCSFTGGSSDAVAAALARFRARAGATAAEAGAGGDGDAMPPTFKTSSFRRFSDASLAGSGTDRSDGPLLDTLDAADAADDDDKAVDRPKGDLPRTFRTSSYRRFSDVSVDSADADALPESLAASDAPQASPVGRKPSAATSGAVAKARAADAHRRAVETAPVCHHYERKCLIVAPCCCAAFGCRLCHDDCPVLSAVKGSAPGERGNASDTGGGSGGGEGEAKTKGMARSASVPASLDKAAAVGHHNVDRFAIAEVICRECFAKQGSKTNACVNCHVQFSEYHCEICNLWMSKEEEPFHCGDCGVCRVGGAANFRHCVDCNTCVDRARFAAHTCRSGGHAAHCPVCHDDLNGGRDSAHELPCGHALHWLCFRELAVRDSVCPVCEKTAETRERMRPAWDALAGRIAAEPVAPEECKVVSIRCRDCEGVQEDRAWHSLGVRCQECESFNTIVERIKILGQEAHTYLLGEGELQTEGEEGEGVRRSRRATMDMPPRRAH
ncbi:hypothetical protein ACHAXT_011796 [Thalassiosira profunda]